MNCYEVLPLRQTSIEVSVPASKSILNRALILSAFTEGETRLHAPAYGQDTRDLLSCLSALGVGIGRTGEFLLVHGTRTPRKRATLNVGSAGTAARFLTAVLAALGGDYTIDASEQMKRRPMDLFGALERAGVEIQRLGSGDFPFRMRTSGISADELTVDTGTSTQYASGLLLAAALGTPFAVRLTGPRTEGGYIATTVSLLEAFGATVSSKAEGAERILTVTPALGRAEYAVPADFSAACYFYALSLFGKKVLVRGAHSDCGQSDLKFLSLLRERGVTISETDEGILADGTGVAAFDGFVLDMRDFSDQALTLAALTPFAATPTRLTGIGHIRSQECDRIAAAAENLSALGVPCSADGDSLTVEPAVPRSVREKVRIRTFSDHRVAMAFALVGLVTGNVLIEDPDCCKKTFDTYFSVLDGLTART